MGGWFSTSVSVSGPTVAEMNPVVAVALVALAIGLTQGCTDANANCVNWVKNSFCSSNFYSSAQKAQYCAASCNLCNGAVTGGTSTCVDSNSNCGTWVANGFCTSGAYTADQIRQYCCASCPNVALTTAATTGSTGASDSTTAPTGDTTTGPTTAVTP